MTAVSSMQGKARKWSANGRHRADRCRHSLDRPDAEPSRKGAAVPFGADCFDERVPLASNAMRRPDVWRQLPLPDGKVIVVHQRACTHGGALRNSVQLPCHRRSREMRPAARFQRSSYTQAWPAAPRRG
jgi:hypothetical protein